jgi:hypothetical protein
MPDMAAKEPGAHAEGMVEAAAQADPAGHCEHSAAAVRRELFEYVPAGQLKGAIEAARQ